MFCESCLDAAREEGADEDILEMALEMMGSDIADHICEEQEGGEPCACPCH